MLFKMVSKMCGIISVQCAVSLVVFVYMNVNGMKVVKCIWVIHPLFYLSIGVTGVTNPN